MEFLYFVGPLVGGLILYAITNAVVRAPGASLSQKFANLGTLSGKSYSEITRAVGAPNSVSSTINAEGKKVYIRQWMATGYHIVLLFDENDICLGVSSETAV